MVELFIDPEAANTQTADAKENKQRRRWVRLEICSPVGVQEIIVDHDHRSVHRISKEKTGMILNISGGGVLLSTFDSFGEDDYLLLKFEIKDFEVLADVLARVKRIEKCPDGESLIGVEFLTPEKMDDGWLSETLTGLVEDPLGFSDRLHQMVSRYVFRRQVAEKPTESS